ncbi:Olfactory receptor [Apodemus speciosus]|uniref:Olfactory receptor n=1 Tax=Apodemus speciosus TaxID=105296 RepID=A0ABQ0F000_APOSI
MRRLCTGPCTTSWPYYPSLMSPCVQPQCPICCAYSGSVSRRLDLIPALSRCFCPHVYCNGVWCAHAHGPGPLCSHLLSSTIYHHPHQPSDCQGWSCHILEECNAHLSIHSPHQALALLQGHSYPPHLL